MNRQVLELSINDLLKKANHTHYVKMQKEMILAQTGNYFTTNSV
jgi:hypothetical protein